MLCLEYRNRPLGKVTFFTVNNNNIYIYIEREREREREREARMGITTCKYGKFNLRFYNSHVTMSRFYLTRLFRETHLKQYVSETSNRIDPG